MARHPSPPRDSWIAIGPGQSAMFDIKAMHEMGGQMARFGREFRGTLLASAFEIESIIETILLSALFPGPDSQLAEQRKFFDEQLLKRRTNFANKINLLSKAREAISGLDTIIPEDTIKKLNRARLVRNDCAHYPVSLIPDGPAPIAQFKAVLCGAENDTELNAENVNDIYQLFYQLTHDLNEAARAIGKGALAPSATPPATPRSQAPSQP